MITKPMTKDEYQIKYGVQPFSSSTLDEKEIKEANKGSFATGLLKSGLSTAKGLLNIGSKIGGAVLPDAVFQKNLMTEESLGKNTLGFEKYLTKDYLKTRGTAEKIGKFTGDVAQFAIPGAKVNTATKALSTIPKYAARAATSGLIGSAQTEGSLKGGAIAAGTELAIPVAGAVLKPVGRLMGRLFKGIGSGLSGASSKQIETVLSNPQSAARAVKEIKQAGGANALRKSAQEIVEGVSSVRQGARESYKKGLEELAETDINPATFRDTIGPTLNKFGSSMEGGKRILQNVEFDDPKNIRKASELIDRLSTVKLDGKSLRKLADDIENAAYKTATSDERLAFNSFVKGLSGSLKKAVSNSTSKLDEINKAFSKDIQLAEGIEQIFGKVKFKNAKEIGTVARKLERLFSLGELDEQTVNNFLTKIGIEPSEFYAGEAARQIGNLAEKTNPVGTNPFEIFRSFTSALVPPKAVRDLAIVTGIAENNIKEIAQKLSPLTRAVVVKKMLGINDNP